MEFVEVASTEDLADGAMRAVDVGGKRVLLALVEGQTYAIGAVCTHERAFLDEGALEGHEVYCPRHFSCFDVRTGEALEPPADRPTPTYAVKVTDGKVLVSAEPVEAGEGGVAASGAEAAEPAAEEQPADEAAVDEQPAAEEQPADEPSVEEERAAEPATEEPSGAEPAPEPTADEATAAERQGAEDVPAREPEPVAAAAADAATDGAPASQPSPAPQRSAQVRPRLTPAGPAAWQHRVLELAEDLPIVENGAEALGAAIQPFRESRAGRRVFDLLHGRVLGHALHPALSDLPIGFWSATVLLDAIGEHRAAGVLSGAGVAAGVATAVTGVADWTVSDGRDRRTGLVHGVLQTAALGLHAASLAARSWSW